MSKDIIIDEGVSGGIPFEERAGGKLVMKRVASGKFGHIISLKLDRMSRDQIDAVQTIDMLDVGKPNQPILLHSHRVTAR